LIPVSARFIWRTRFMPPLFHLDHFDLIACQGKDAEAFLQSQLSNDLRALAEQNTQWNAFLSPQGRVLAVMLLIRLDAEQFLLAVPYRQGAQLLEQLRKFLLRRKATLVLDETRCLYGARDVVSTDDLLQLALTLPNDRRLFVGEKTLAAPATSTDWQKQDMQAGIPWLPPAAAGRHLPHALGLDKLPAISLKKGCYPGQEIVARTQYLGRNKRCLCLLHTPGHNPAMSAGDTVRDPENQLAGELVDVIADEAGTWMLAVLSDDKLQGQLTTMVEPAGPCVLGLVKRF
jgi:tRNA-modifying protein YgfZ